jgi:hypothetical protein
MKKSDVIENIYFKNTNELLPVLLSINVLIYFNLAIHMVRRVLSS